MSTDKKKPWGDAFATKAVSENKTVWIPLGPVWQADGGALTLTLDAMPVHWDDSKVERRIVVKRRETQQGGSRGR